MSGATDWRTPRALFEEWDEEFHFNVDAAADDKNALIDPWSTDHPSSGRYFTAETDGSNPDHYSGDDVVFCNPPYSPAPLLYRFVQTAVETSKRGALWVMLLNATTTDTRFFHDFIWDREFMRPRDRVELRLMPGRIIFHDENDQPIPHPTKANMVVVFRPPLPKLGRANRA